MAKPYQHKQHSQDIHTSSDCQNRHKLIAQAHAQNVDKSEGEARAKFN